MNSLTYLSRQLDVLASSGGAGPRSVSEPSGKNESPGKLKRTRTWNKPLLQGLQPPPPPRTKRSFSLPAFVKSGFAISSTPAPRHSLGPIVSSDDSPVPNRKHKAQHMPRIYFIRALFIIWNTICEAWHYIVKNIHRPWWFDLPSSKTAVIGDSEVDEATSVEEKDSDDSDDFDPLVARSPTKRVKRIAPLNEHSSPSSSSPSLLSHTLSDLTQKETKSRYPDMNDSSSSSPSNSSNLLPNPFSTSLLTQASTTATPSRSPSPLPSLRKTPFHLPKTLVLDLDETLIHSTSKPLTSHTGGTGLLGLGGRRNKGTGHMVEVVLGGRSTLYHVYKRPFVDYFLRKVSSWYTLVVFTASMQEYADPVIDWLDAGRGILTRRFFRESCTQLPSGSYIKDLSLVEPDLSRVCLIDNSPISYNINQANGIPIEGWTHDMADEALLDLLPVLDSLRFTSDVRRVLGMRGF